MPNHIQVNGKPWCECNDLRLHLARESAKAGMEGPYFKACFVMCVPDNPGADTQLLREVLPNCEVKLVAGPCPTYTGERIE